MLVSRIYRDSPLKGQIIPKVFVVSSDSSKKRQTNSFLVLLGKKTNSFVRFLEESEDTKSRFEIIWPLAKFKQWPLTSKTGLWEWSTGISVPQTF